MNGIVKFNIKYQVLYLEKLISFYLLEFFKFSTQDGTLNVPSTK